MKTLVLMVSLASGVATGADLRIGIVGTDTSHVPAFTKLLNDAAAADHVAGGRVVAAYPGGSDDVESSYTRVKKFADEVRDKYGVEIVDSISTLCAKVDAVLIESVDGRKHLEQARAVIAAGKPFFIDKPLASTLEDAREIARLADAARVPWFSASSLRFAPLAEMKSPQAVGYDVWGPSPFEPHHQLDLSWYGIHPVELLYTLMGPGCLEVSRISSEGSDAIVGRWKDGRIGTVRGLRPYGPFGVVVYQGEKTVVSDPEKSREVGYDPLVRKIIEFFQTGKPPVANSETLEIFAFMDAAQRSKESGGAMVKLR
jgi:hypothetical protein